MRAAGECVRTFVRARQSDVSNSFNTLPDSFNFQRFIKVLVLDPYAKASTPVYEVLRTEYPTNETLTLGAIKAKRW